MHNSALCLELDINDSIGKITVAFQQPKYLTCSLEAAFKDEYMEKDLLPPQNSLESPEQVLLQTIGSIEIELGNWLPQKH